MKYNKVEYSYEHGVSGKFLNYVAHLEHTGLNEKKILKSKDEADLVHKVNKQFAAWELKFEKNNAKSAAESNTAQAIEELNTIEQTLTSIINSQVLFSWDSLNKSTYFEEPNPMDELEEKLKNLTVLDEPELSEIPVEPLRTDKKFNPEFNFLEKRFKSLIIRRIKKNDLLFKKAHKNWGETVERINASNEKALQEYSKQRELLEADKKHLIAEYEKPTRDWKKKNEQFKNNIDSFNSNIARREKNYMDHFPDEVIFYNSQIINKLPLYKTFPNKFELYYITDSKMLAIEYFLPSLEDIPTLKEVRYQPTKDDTKEYHLTPSHHKSLYDDTVYKLVLGIVHMIFKADIAEAIDIVNINGWVTALDKRIGKKVNTCILSLQVLKKEFAEINLLNVDPRLCFRSLKGVGSSDLSGLAAIQPILTINKNDKRFTASRNVDYDDSTNLALMDWEDFEHLIRELFGKEFATGGGEVKVTRASRDGGVDAIAFDPDPIRGGKIVIQAKRYTNVVGVSAVRDLYGTVLNEGAIKGILVTTAEYGSDSYQFAKDKPITLLNGGNLLHLLQKHGHKARIDIKEAKQIMKDLENKK